MDLKDILKKKYEVLKTSLKFKDIDNYDVLLNNYVETANALEKDIEKEYQDKLADFNYSTKTLEEEKKRLEDFYDYSEKKMGEQQKFLKEFADITGYELNDAILIAEDYESKLRLDSINKYFSNNQEIQNLENDNKKFRDLLKENTAKKESNVAVNNKLEIELKKEFTDVITKADCFEGIDLEDLNFEMEKLSYKIEESKLNLDNFYLAYQTLENGDISSDKRREYQSYVNEARREYYALKEKEILIKSYRLINKNIDDYESLYEKREKLELLLEERLILRKQLQIISSDYLAGFYNVAKEQFSIIKKEQIVMDNLINYENMIKANKERIIAIKQDNESIDILKVLNEYGIIDTYDLDEQEEIIEEIPDFVGEETLDKEITKVRDSEINDFDIIQKKSSLVMETVAQQILPQKNLKKSDEKKEEKIFSEPNQEVEIFSSLNNQEKPKDIFEIEDNDSKPKDIFVKENTIKENKDIFVESKDKDVFVGKDIKEEDDFFLPNEKVELINDTEDNTNKINDIKEVETKMEMNDIDVDDDFLVTRSDFPDVNSFGSVKPLSNIEDIEKKVEDLKDINLPTNGIINKNDDVTISGNDYVANKEGEKKNE